MFKVLRYIIMTFAVTVGVPAGTWLCGFGLFLFSIGYIGSAQPEQPLDAAIVLTGGSNRVSQGFDLLAAGKVKYLLVSGVHNGVKLSDLLDLWHGNRRKIDTASVTLGREAGNTIGNAIEAADWIKAHGINDAYIITSTYHMPRALLEFRHIDRQVPLVPYAVQPSDFSTESGIYWKTVFLEYNKLLISVYRVVMHPHERQPFPPSLTQ